MINCLRRRCFFLLIIIAFSCSLHDVVNGQDVVGFTSEILSDVTIPQSISDFTVVKDDNNMYAYLSGGCNSSNGNEYNTEYGEFICESISDTQYVYDLQTNTFDVTKTSTMPVQRYRHAAVYINNRIWLVGGRDLFDEMIEQIDMYDINSGSWSTYNGLDGQYFTSDLAGFAGQDNNLAYFVGGYNFTYSAQNIAFAIDTEQTVTTNTLVITKQPNLPTRRGDISAISILDTTDNNNYAIVTGGFTHENEWCEPLGTVELFNFNTNTWSSVADLITPRGDKAVAEVNGRIYAIAGERQIPNICTVSDDNRPEPGEETVPIDDIEWYNPNEDMWYDIQDLDHHRFRFAAIGYGNTIIAFGGQLSYNEICQCFPTSNEIIIFTEEIANDDNTDTGDITNTTTTAPSTSMTTTMTPTMAPVVSDSTTAPTKAPVVSDGTTAPTKAPGSNEENDTTSNADAETTTTGYYYNIVITTIGVIILQMFFM